MIKHLNPFLLFFLVLSLGCKDAPESKTEVSVVEAEPITASKPTISLTFDDGLTIDWPGYAFKEWNGMILSHLETADLQAVFFVTGNNKSDAKGQYLLESWDNKGHRIANHTYTHPFFNAEANNAELFESELLKTDAIISKYNNYTKMFRFPYLKEGQNATKVDSIRAILSKHNYQNGYVTIDASDWYIDQRLRQRIKNVGLENTEINAYRDYYIEHILDRANYYEELSYDLHGRHINHTLLLHHNLTSALFLGDLITAFKEAGWNVIDADKAFKDEIFTVIPRAEYAGESLIYSIAKQSGKYNDHLRYPAEDSRYEKVAMDSLGL